MLCNDLRIYNNKIYSKKANLKISWDIHCTLSEMKNDINIILNQLVNSYPQQLGHLDFNDLDFNDLNFAFFKLQNSFLSNINFFDNVIEFKDGIFFLNDKKFLQFNELDYSKLKTVFYVDFNYYDFSFTGNLLTKLYKKLDVKNFSMFINDI